MEAKPAAINKTLYRAYRGELSKLTFNSKPIINDLSKRAMASISDAETILKAIEDHLRFTVPNLKLPTFYLLDSIIKNVGGMYVDLLYGRLERIFVDVWKSVDGEVKGKLERTMRTWRDGFEGGRKNLFPEFVLRKIEEDIAKLKARAPPTNGAAVDVAEGADLLDNLTSMQSHARKRALEQQQHAMHQAVVARTDAYDAAAGRLNGSGGSRQQQPEHLSKRQRAPERAQGVLNQGLLQEVNKVVVKKRVELLRRPNDVMLFNTLNALNEIKAVVSETELSRDKINEIRDQLLYLDGGDVGQPPQQQAPLGGSTTPPYAPPPMQALRDVSLSDGGAGGDANQLLNTLMARPDLVTSLSKVAPGLSTSLGALLVPAHQAGTEYKLFSQLEPIPLTVASIARKRHGIHNILYQGGYPRQCSQCGWRAMDSEEGRGKMNGHLDWHFRRNIRTQGDQVRKAPMRGWYVDQVSLWESATNAAAAATGATLVESSGGSVDSSQQGRVNKHENDVGEEKVVPVTDSYNNEPCAVCREPFERRFIEDEESWVLVNAISVDGKVYHAMCQRPAEPGK
ncbi:mRNA 3' end processing factor [Coemansia sp. BCRC 34301]|nr:mRNA 3' end processing factor [Coemansia sp. BCRC 34301]